MIKIKIGHVVLKLNDSNTTKWNMIAYPLVFDCVEIMYVVSPCQNALLYSLNFVEMFRGTLECLCSDKCDI